MKKIYFMLLSALLLVLAGCNKEKTPSDNTTAGESDDYVYMDISMQLPTSGAGTKSSTDWEDEDKADGENNNGDSNSDATTDTEKGWDYENTVKTALLVIASVDDEYLTHAEVTGILKGTDNGRYDIKAKFKREDIDKMYKEGPLSGDAKEKHVKIYAYVNYTNNVYNLFNNIENNGGRENNAWLHWSGKVEELPSKAGQTPIIDNTIWAKHSFLMTNSTLFYAKFPDTADEWDSHADEKHPYSVAETSGSISVERAAARIDFKDGSKDSEGNPNNNTYNIIGGISSTTQDELNLIDVQLTRMSLVNMSKNFYYLRRVSDGYDAYQQEMADNTVKVGKYETSKNYVVDTDWTAKLNGDIKPENSSEYFNFPVYGKEQHVDHYPYNRGSWYTDNINDVLTNNDKDNWNDKSYRIWRYVTENTLPAIDGQKTVQSTGVIFKGLILPGKDITAAINENDHETRYLSAEVEKALIASKHHLPKYGDGEDNTSTEKPWDGGSEDAITAENMSYVYPTLYEFDGLLYAGFDEVVKRAMVEGQGSLLYAAAQWVLKHWVLEDNTFVHKAEPDADDVTLNVLAYNEIRNGAEHIDNGTVDYTEGYSIEFDESAEYFKAYATTFNDPEASNFTLYEASYEDVVTEHGEGWGYYCYYFYWNRHNDNNLSGKMGQMEFATVRNNVYKLSVSTINRLGHPRNPDNDPDPYDPEDPDEESRVYLTVSIEVLPWVVRENNIEF